MTIAQDRIARILSWFQKARPNPDDEDFHSQIGVHFEEVAEMVSEITPRDEFTGALLTAAHETLTELGDHLKRTVGAIEILPENRVEFLDSLGDQMVTGVGVAWTQQLDICGGVDEINRSNFSKFVEGLPIIVAGTLKKIGKGPDYSKADLRPFV